jgi:protein NEDD1
VCFLVRLFYSRLDPFSRRLFRNILLKTPLTSLAFSPEGAALYVGTEHGKVLVLDLRALDKDPAVVVSEGERIIGMTVMVGLRSFHQL